MLDENQPVTDLRRPIAPRSAPSQPIHQKEDPKGSSSWKMLIWETVRYALVAAAIIIPVRIFIAQPFIVSGLSMYPTFHDGEYLIVDELSKYIGDYRRGDVVILRYPNDPSKFFIKRVIGLPGETVTVDGEKVTITGPTHSAPEVLDEPYVKNPKMDHMARTLDADEYFVMGDNRAQSSDSRIWGPVPSRLMDGKAFLRLLPITRAELHPGGLDHFGVNYK
jgi:signal peptidase I